MRHVQQGIRTNDNNTNKVCRREKMGSHRALWLCIQSTKRIYIYIWVRVFQGLQLNPAVYIYIYIYILMLTHHVSELCFVPSSAVEIVVVCNVMR